jgi:putative peptidoglycan lipid II flippase
MLAIKRMGSETVHSLIAAGIRRFGHWTAIPVNRRILSAAMAVGFASVLVKGVSFFKEITVAFYFGTDRSLDIFLIALALPTFGISVLGGAIQSAFTPTYLDVLHKRGRGASRALLGSLSLVFAVFLGFTAVLMALGAQWLLRVVASGFSAAELMRARHIFYVLVPILVFTGIARLYSALLAAEHKFTLPAIAAMATPLCTIAALLLAYGVLGIYSLVIAATLGALLELLVLAWLMVRTGVMPAFSWGGFTPELRQVFAQFFPLIAGTVLMAGTTVTDQAMAAMLPAGAISALNYGIKLPAVANTLISGAIGTAVLPYFSRMIAAGDWQGVLKTYGSFVRFIFFATVPISVVLIALSYLIIRAAFQHGSFSAADTHVVTYVQMCLLLEIPFYTVGILAVRMIAALKKTVVLVWGAVISLVLNVTLNYLFMQVLGVAGIALSTSVVYLVSMIYLLLMSKRYITTASIADSL